jgi:deoxyribose-phosphate aldolase
MMKELDQETIETIIEQITRQVLLVLEDESARNGGSRPDISAANFVQHVQPVVSAGADRIASTLGLAPADESVAPMIDHTILKPDATHDQIAQLCYEARKHQFASVCVSVRSCWRAAGCQYVR